MRDTSRLDHLSRLSRALERSVRAFETSLEWGQRLSSTLPTGSRLLVGGNGGSAAQAQHLTAELVCRYRQERRPFSAIALHAETSALTAIVNDYGQDEMFARQVEAHGRPGDICLLMSTSGTSRNILNAARRARACQVEVWSMTGPEPNPVAALSDDALCIEADDTAAVQELHLVALHMMCEELDAKLLAPGLLLEQEAG
jgi:D-sedoheptulose 7-phosphate isomerase